MTRSLHAHYNNLHVPATILCFRWRSHGAASTLPKLEAKQGRGRTLQKHLALLMYTNAPTKNDVTSGPKGAFVSQCLLRKMSKKPNDTKLPSCSFAEQAVFAFLLPEVTSFFVGTWVYKNWRSFLPRPFGQSKAYSLVHGSFSFPSFTYVFRLWPCVVGFLPTVYLSAIKEELPIVTQALTTTFFHLFLKRFSMFFVVF